MGPLTVLADAIKNPSALLAAWARLPAALRARTILVFFSREAAPRPEIAGALAADGQLRFVAQPSRDELVLLMNAADVFVFPSFYEGFGLPLVEAMQCGLPIVASARGAIPEVVGGAGLLFSLETSDECADRLQRVLTDEDLRNRLRRASLERAREFSWDRAARATLAVYQQAFDADRSQHR
jgi:glycosyltransferase involved in cell wall biosynthesis